MGCRRGGVIISKSKMKRRERGREEHKLVISLSGREGLLALYLLHTHTHAAIKTPWCLSHPLSFRRQIRRCRWQKNKERDNTERGWGGGGRGGEETERQTRNNLDERGVGLKKNKKTKQN